jgi:nucleoside recognition membrane protein YjiH
MSTRLETYIKENKKSFDTELPSKELWTKIDATLNKKKKNEPYRLKLWIAVAASLCVAMSIIFYFTLNEIRPTQTVSDVSPAYAKKQVRYASLIERKTDSLEVLAKENPQLYHEFSADLQEIKSNYKQLKKQLPKSANQALVEKAMQKNLELQLQVVSQQLTIINQVNQYKKENLL